MRAGVWNVSVFERSNNRFVLDFDVDVSAQHLTGGISVGGTTIDYWVFSQGSSTTQVIATTPELPRGAYKYDIILNNEVLLKGIISVGERITP